MTKLINTICIFCIYFKYCSKFACSILIETYATCEELLRKRPMSGNGFYRLKSGTHYCFMDKIPACDGRGWTVAAKINGVKASTRNEVYFSIAP